MDERELENRLRGLSTARPGDGLRGRIFGDAEGNAIEKPSGCGDRVRRGGGIPLSWAAALALICGAGGYRFGAASGNNEAPPPAALVVKMQVIEAPRGKVMFDFSSEETLPLPGELSVRIESGNEA